MIVNKYERIVRGIKPDFAGQPVEALVDVYEILRAYGVESHPVAHAIKNLLLAGQRGHKDRLTDLREARQALDRAIEDEGGA